MNFSGLGPDQTDQVLHRQHTSCLLTCLFQDGFQPPDHPGGPSYPWMLYHDTESGIMHRCRDATIWLHTGEVLYMPALPSHVCSRLCWLFAGECLTIPATYSCWSVQQSTWLYMVPLLARLTHRCMDYMRFSAPDPSAMLLCSAQPQGTLQYCTGAHMPSGWTKHVYGDCTFSLPHIQVYTQMFPSNSSWTDQVRAAWRPNSSMPDQARATRRPNRSWTDQARATLRPNSSWTSLSRRFPWNSRPEHPVLVVRLHSNCQDIS